MTDENQDMSPEEEAAPENAEESFGDEPIIPEEDFREAIAVCRKDPQLNRLFEMAPPGAKLFIGLGFYSTHFAGKVDPRQYAKCQAEIEPSLTTADLTYLIRFERDTATKQYLRELLAQRKAEEASETEEVATEEVAPEAEETVAEEPPPKPSKGLLRSPLRRQPSTPPPGELAPPAELAFPKVWRKAEAGPTKSSRGLSIRFDVDFAGLFKFAAQIALLLGGAFALYIAFRPSAPQPEEEPPAEETPAAPAPEAKPPPAEVAARTDAPSAQTPSAEQKEQTYAVTDASEKDAHRPDTAAPADVALEARTPAETNATAVAVAASERRTSGRPRVVFTDGKKIVRRPGGPIEVPRVFSCAGAGVRPFWVYDKHPEADAAREKKARDEWQALVQQARQAEKEASGGDRPAGAGANML